MAAITEEQKSDKTPTQHEQSDHHAPQSIEASSHNTSLAAEDSDDDDGGYMSPKPLWRLRCCAPSVENKCIEDWSSFTLEVLSPIRAMIVSDDDIKFKSFLHVSKIKFLFDNVFLNYAGHDLCAYGILGKLCHYGSSKCARALLSHEAGSMLNLKIENCYGDYPLNAAAMRLSPDLVKILVDHGAVCESPSWTYMINLGQNISPLDYAVESLSCGKNFISWSLQKSVYKLIITLCLPQMREARETISFLAGVADSHTLFDTIYNAVKRGQVVAVAALLLLARDKVLSLSFFGSLNNTGSLVFHKAIKNELAAVINQKYAIMGKKDHTMLLKLCLEKEELMIYILQLLEIFTRSGPELDLLLDNSKSKSDVLTNEDVSSDVAKLLNNASFTVSDTSDSFLKSEPVLSQEYNAEDDPEDYLFKPSRDQLCRCGMYHPTCTSREVFLRIGANSFSYGQHRGLSSHAGPFVQKLWAIPQRKLLGKVELGDKRDTIVREKSGKWLEFQMSKRIVRSGSVLMAALRRGVRGV